MGTLDYLAVFCVFAGLLTVGYVSSRKVKKADDFLLAGRSLNKWEAGLSVAASDLGGSGLIGTCALCYTIGFSGGWWCWTATPAFILLAFFLVDKLRPLAVSTVSEYLEIRYDTRSRVLATFMQLCAVVANLSAQLLVGAVALETLFGVSKSIGMVISAVLLLSYTALGGLTAVVHTDMFNFFVLIGSLLVSIPIALKKAGGFAFVEQLPDSFFSVGELGIMEPLSWVFMCIFMYGTQQVFLQRVFAANNKSTARFSYCFTGGMYVVYGFLVALIGVIMAVLEPGLADTNEVYTHMLKTVLPSGLAGFALGGIFAATLSTADSTVLAGATLFANDIYRPFINKKASDSRTLWVSRIAAIVICVGSMGLASLMENLIDIVYLGGLFYSAAVFFPIILGLYWKRGTATGAFAAILSSLVVGLATEFIFDGAIWGIPSNMLAAFIGICVQVIVSLCTPPTASEKESLLGSSLDD